MNLSISSLIFAVLVSGLSLIKNSAASDLGVCKKQVSSPAVESLPKSEAQTTYTLDKTPSCSFPSADLVAGRLVNGTVGRQPNLLPPWVNLTLARQGQKWAAEHMQVGGSHLFGLMFILAFPDGNSVLLFTNQSDTADKAAKRYASTMQQVRTWYTNELKEDTEDNPALQSILRLRGLHTAAMEAGNERLHGEKSPLIAPELYERASLDESMWAAFDADLEQSHIPAKSRTVPASYTGRVGNYYSVSQFQLAMTQFAFVGFPVLFPERILLLDAKDEDLVAFNHLWAVLGYALGIDDKFNIALQPDLKSTREYYQSIFDDWFLPSLFNLDFHSKLLLEAQLKGFEKIEEIFTPKTLLFRLLSDIVNIPVPNMMRELSLKDHQKLLEFNVKGIRGYLDKLRTMPGGIVGNLPPPRKIIQTLLTKLRERSK